MYKITIIYLSILLSCNIKKNSDNNFKSVILEKRGFILTFIKMKNSNRDSIIIIKQLRLNNDCFQENYTIRKDRTDTFYFKYFFDNFSLKCEIKSSNISNTNGEIQVKLGKNKRNLLIKYKWHLKQDSINYFEKTYTNYTIFQLDSFDLNEIYNEFSILNIFYNHIINDPNFVSINPFYYHIEDYFKLFKLKNKIFGKLILSEKDSTFEDYEKRGFNCFTFYKYNLENEFVGMYQTSENQIISEIIKIKNNYFKNKYQSYYGNGVESIEINDSNKNISGYYISNKDTIKYSVKDRYFENKNIKGVIVSSKYINNYDTIKLINNFINK